MSQIQCKDCAVAHETARKDTRYCPSCSLLRTLVYAAAQRRRKTRCGVCQTHFITHRDGHKQLLCGECLIPTLKYPYIVDCVFCRRSKAGPDRRVPVCFPCVRDPATRPRIIEGLLKGQKRRKEANSCTESPES